MLICYVLTFCGCVGCADSVLLIPTPDVTEALAKDSLIRGGNWSVSLCAWL